MMVQFLLSAGVKFVLTNHFCQHPVEQCFGKQREIGRRSDHPTIYTFGYYDNKIRMYRSNAQILGNTSGKTSTQKRAQAVDDTPLPRWKRKKLSN